MALSTTTYALSKKYTDKSIEGLGAIKGAPCTIKSTTETSEGTEVVFEWTGTGGTTETKTITIKNGVSITDIEINSNKHLICTMSDGSTIDAGEVPNIKGDTGFSPTIEENPNNTDEIYKLDITNESGTFTTPNLKGTAGGLDPDRYYDKTQVDALIEPLNEAKHTHENKENVLDKLTTNATGDILLFNGQKIKGSVEIDDTTTTAEDKAWSAKKTNDTIDKVKTWVNSEESLAIKTALYNNNTLMFYKKPNATIDDTADFSINLPEEQFLDQTKTTFINNFVWSEELYPNSTNPNLDNEPVLVLAVKGDTDVVYSFVSMNELVKIYKASTTVSTVTLTIDDAANTISAEVNISADEGNLLKIGTDGGLYAKATVDNALSDTSENPVQNKVINVALNSKANASDLSDHTNNADIHVTAEEKTSWNNKADRQSYAPIFSGDILDIPEMGTYSCHISNCSNLPSGIYDWGYVTMYNFNNPGYKRFICTPLDALGHSYSGKPNGMIYLASEAYKDTDGNLIWSRACDGGDATTLESLPAKDFLQNLGTWSTGNIDDLILGANKSGIVWINTTVTGMPVEGKFWFGIIDCSNAHRCLRVTSQTDGQSFVRAYNSASQYWYAWHNIADGGNADTVDGLHASDIQIDSVSDTAESVTLDELQGGVPFSEIVLNGDIIGQDVTLTACGKNLADLSDVDGKLISGISFAYDNGNVVLNGTSTATTTTYLGIKMHLSAGTYTVSGGMDKNVRVVLRNKSWVNIADSTAGATVTVTSDDYYVHIAITAGTVCDNVVIKPQLERGAVATEYEPYNGNVTTITPDSNPYTVPNNIRQQDGLNNISVSAGEVSVTGVKRNAAVKKIWDNKADLSDIQIDTVSDTAGVVTLDGLQGGVPFSEITLSGDIVGQEITLRAGGENLLTFNSHNGTETISGVTFARLPDGTITANGTATDIAQYLSDTVEMSDGNTYTLTGCPVGGSGEGYSITNQATANITDMGSGKTFAYDAATFGAARFKIRIAAGYTCNNVVFRPVLCSGSAVITKITPNSAPYIITDDIRQRDGVNTISVSAGNVTVTGVRNNMAVKRIWAKLDELTAAIIVSNGETTE